MIESRPEVEMEDKLVNLPPVEQHCDRVCDSEGHADSCEPCLTCRALDELVRMTEEVGGYEIP